MPNWILGEKDLFETKVQKIHRVVLSGEDGSSFRSFLLLILLAINELLSNIFYRNVQIYLTLEGWWW